MLIPLALLRVLLENLTISQKEAELEFDLHFVYFCPTMTRPKNGEVGRLLFHLSNCWQLLESVFHKCVFCQPPDLSFNTSLKFMSIMGQNSHLHSRNITFEWVDYYGLYWTYYCSLGNGPSPFWTLHEFSSSITLSTNYNWQIATKQRRVVPTKRWTLMNDFVTFTLEPLSGQTYWWLTN